LSVPFRKHLFHPPPRKASRRGAFWGIVIALLRRKLVVYGASLVQSPSFHHFTSCSRGNKFAKDLAGKDLGFTLNYGSEQFTNRKETIMIMKRFALVSATLALALLMLSETAPSATLLLENSPGGVC
jgi:hypothetical protein